MPETWWVTEKVDGYIWGTSTTAVSDTPDDLFAALQLCESNTLPDALSGTARGLKIFLISLERFLRWSYKYPYASREVSANDIISYYTDKESTFVQDESFFSAFWSKFPNDAVVLRVVDNGEKYCYFIRQVRQWSYAIIKVDQLGKVQPYNEVSKVFIAKWQKQLDKYYFSFQYPKDRQGKDRWKIQ